MSVDFKIGCDPEVFVQETFSGRLVTAHGLIPGDKKTPHKVDGGAIQVDGMALEFNTDPVSIRTQGFAVFNDKILRVLRGLKARLPNHTIVYESSVVFDPEYYASQVPEDAKELGCDPDFNAWLDGAQNPSPDALTSMRGAAGHIHIGWGEDIPHDHPDHIAVCCDFIKALDYYVGLGMVLLEDEAGARRKEAYGKAGAFRPKSYGVEYRTPSNAWISSESRRSFIFMLVQKAIADMQKKTPMWKTLRDTYKVDVPSIINGGKEDYTACVEALYPPHPGKMTQKKTAAHVLANLSVGHPCISGALANGR